MPTASPLEDELAALPRELLVGVSGGVDSVALLHALVATGRKPVVVHFNHRWRQESGAEAKFVRKLAGVLSLKFVLGSAKRKTVRHREAEARDERFEFFAHTAQGLDLPNLALAHQADDQVETFLLQLLRGAGAGGRGMDPLTRRGELILHRPWLGVWRKDVLAYAKRHRLAWREDDTNSDLQHRRNLIRHRLLPYLRRQISPQVAENLWRAAEIAREDGQWLDTLCAEPADADKLEVKAVRASPIARQRRVVLRWLQGRGIRNISFDDVEAVRGLAESVTPAKVNLSGGKFARRRAGKLFVE